MDEEYRGMPQTPQEANMSEVHRRYFVALVIIVAFVAAFSYQTPSAMYRMLHAHEDGVTPMSYALVTADGTGEVYDVPDDVEALVANAKCSHMVQKDAEIGEGCILLFPNEDTGYGVVFFPDGSGYTYAADAMKLRGKVNDGDGAIFAAVSGLAESAK